MATGQTVSPANHRYEQQLSVERDAAARAIMADAQQEAFKRFGMDLEYLLRRKPQWKVALQGILFRGGDIVECGEQAEQASATEATETLAEQEEEALPL